MFEARGCGYVRAAPAAEKSERYVLCLLEGGDPEALLRGHVWAPRDQLRIELRGALEV